MRRNVARIIIDLVILTCIFTMPWWVALSIAIASSIFFKTYFELVVTGFIIDSIYATSTGAYLGIHYVLTLITLIIFLAVIPLKKRLRFNQ